MIGEVEGSDGYSSTTCCDQPFSDVLQFLRICDQDLNTHLHLGFLKAEVKACYLCLGHSLGHG